VSLSTLSTRNYQLSDLYRSEDKQVNFATPFPVDFFLKSSRRVCHSLYQISGDNPQKKIFTLSPLGWNFY
jgi:hypothetical protein